MRLLPYITSIFLLVSPLQNERIRGVIIGELEWKNPDTGWHYKIDVDIGQSTNSYFFEGGKEEMDKLNKAYNSGDCVEITESKTFSKEGTMLLKPADIKKCK